MNINLVTMDGGHKSVAVGLSNYRSLRAHHTVHALRHSRSFMDPSKSELHRSAGRQGEIVEAAVPIFHIETTLNNDMYDGPLAFLAKPEARWTPREQTTFAALKRTTDRMNPKLRRAAFHKSTAPYAVTGVTAGAVSPVHEVTLEHCATQQAVGVRGQADVVTAGLPYVGPYNVNSILNPILVMCMGLGYFFNLYQGVPLVREGGVMIFTHPVTREFHPVHHPSYVDFYEEVLSETTDPVEIEQRFEKGYAEDEWYRHLYRTSYAYHGVHPFYMWYWGAHALQHLGDVIFVGGDPQACRRLGFRRADTHARRAGDGRAGRRARPVADPLPLPAAVLRPGRRMRFARGGRALEKLAGAERRRSGAAPRSAGPRSPPGKDPWADRTAEDEPWLRERRPALVREVAQQALLFPATRAFTQPTVIGAEDLIHAPQPAILAPNHESDIDTPLVLASLPYAWRTRTVVGAASRPLVPQARLRDRGRLLDQHVPVRPRRRPAARPGRGRGAPARRPQRPAVPAGHPRRRAGGLPRRRRRARVHRRRADHPDPHRGHRAGDAQGPRAQPPRTRPRSRSHARCTRAPARRRTSSPSACARRSST